MKTREEEIKQAAEIYYGGIYHKYPMEYFTKGAKWADEHPKNPWISVKDRLPDEKVNVITISELGVINRCYLKKGIWKMVDYILYTDGDEIVYWMPIPELPNNN